MHTGAGEWLWRPLNNPAQVRVSAFADTAPRGFGLLQRDREFVHYDDVEARFGLEPALTERLKAENILYDRDGEGEYFQLYSGTYGEGFFFEVVERRSYRGYGAANAIFRIAALKKQMRPEGIPRDAG